MASDPSLLFECSSHETPIGCLQLAAQELVHSEGHSLTWCDSHHTWGDTLVERTGSLLLEHVCGDDGDARDGRLAGFGGGFLESRLDGVNGSVGEGADSTGNQSNQCCLVRRELAVAVFGLHILEQALQLRVRGEVGSLVRSLSERSKGDSTIERAEPFFPHHGVESVSSASVFWLVDRVR